MWTTVAYLAVNPRAANKGGKAMATYGVYKLAKKKKRRRRRRRNGRRRRGEGLDSLGIEALRKILTHQRSYPILLQ